ncbi:E3 SUMO-protein ligase KIAA1586-like [Tachypleus tridentatus]|uniref:E3 SUMO-protein ligase KIAA1586-like n=1 Tax=Tachypleus tridentatus TaxID=6853 RepID=UPI003FD3B39B
MRSVIADRGLFDVNLVGHATNGANVMVGIKTDVATKFKEECPCIITSHCLAHRLQLAVEKAANQVPYLVKYISILNQFAKSLKYSPKLCRVLEESKSLHGGKATKSSRSNGTWYSRPRLAAWFSPANVMMTHFLAHAVGILGLLSRSLQRAELSYDQAKAIIDGSMLLIQSLVHIPGSYTQTALKELSQAPDASGHTSYRGHDIKDIDKQRETYRSAAESFVEEVVTRLHVAFPDTNIMSFFSIFSPCHSRAVSHKDDLKKLIQHFSPFVNEDEALTQWLILRNIMEQDAHKIRNMKCFYEEYIHQTQQTFPNLSQLAAIRLIILVTCVDCGRGISSYNSIKTDARSNLSVAKTEMLLNLSMKSKHLDQFNFDSAFRYRVTHKDRRGYRSLLKKCASELQVSTSTTSSMELLHIKGHAPHSFWRPKIVAK